MRVIPNPVAGPTRPQSASGAAALPCLNGTDPVRFIRGVVRNSPWIVIAVTAHVVGIAALSLIYVTTRSAAQPESPGVVTIRHEDAADEPVVQATQLETPERWSVPASTAKYEEGPANPSDVVIPDALPGVKGPVTDSDDYDKPPGEFNPDLEASPNLPPGSTGGTSIGVGRIGHVGSKKPSPYLSRNLGGGGFGGGGHGDGLDRGGVAGTKKERDKISVWAALRWLRDHQSPDGHWDSAGFDARCAGNRCDGPGEATYNPGVTGLSLLAYVGAGYTHQTGAFKETVKSGLKYLRDAQDSEGCFGPRTSQHFLYNHACATLAMTEAFGMTGSRMLKEPAQRGIGFILRARNPYMAWRYNVPADGDNDTSVTGWMVMALKSAKLSELEVETGAVKDAIQWVEKMTEPEFGRTGYQQRGSPPARTNEAAPKFPASKSESTTAVGMTVRIFGGRDTKSDEMIGKGADLLVKCLPKWDVDQGSIDFYYWYYGSLAMFQVGGERWKKWNEAMKTSLLDHQRLEKDRCEYGSWDPVDPWSSEGGRVYSTAINCLTMEVYYRYPLLGIRGETK